MLYVVVVVVVLVDVDKIRFQMAFASFVVRAQGNLKCKFFSQLFKYLIRFTWKS